MRTLKVRKTLPTATLPTRAHPTDAGLDLYAAEPVELHPGERALVSTGISVEIPESTVGLICPRSGIALAHGITVVNAPGVIDSGYTGEVKVLLANMSNHLCSFDTGDRIAQMVLTPCFLPLIEETRELAETSRSDQGFGSSGS